MRSSRRLLPGIIAYVSEIPLGYYDGENGTPVAHRGDPIRVDPGLRPDRTADRANVRNRGAAVATSTTYVTVVATKAIVFMRTTGIGLTDLLFVNAGDIARNPLVRKLPGFSALALLLLK